MQAVASARDRTVPQLIRGCAERYGERPFLYFRDEVYSFADMDRMSDRVAAGLQRLGIAKGDKIGILMTNKPEFLATWFGANKAGAVEVPVNTAHRGYLLTYMLDQSDCKALVVDAELLPYLLDVLGDLPKLSSIVVVGIAPLVPDFTGKVWLSWEDLTANSEPPAPVDIAWNDPFVIMFTSGTTGPSKGSVMPHNYAWVMAETMIRCGSYTEKDCLYNVLPLFHGNSQVLQTMAALASGARMVLRDHFSASAFWDEIRRYDCTVFNYIGTILSVLMKADPTPGDQEHRIRVMVGAGAGPGLFAAFEKRFGVMLIEGYGMSEIGLPLVSTPTARRPGTCGRPSDFFEIKLVDDDGMPVGPNCQGELLVRTRKPWSMMLGYYNMPERTVEAWQDLWFHTGDYLQYDDDGYFSFVDRKKDAMRRRGENISSFEVERSLSAHPAILECAAIPAPSELGEDEVMVCLVLKEGHSVSAPDLSGWCETNMAGFMVPRYYRFMSALPKTPTARVEKYRLRQEGITPDTWDRGSTRR